MYPIPIQTLRRAPILNLMQVNSVTFSKWGKEDGKVAKIRITVDIEEANDLWKEQVTKLKQHIHRKRKQATALESDKRNLSANEILIHCDFSQSYKNSE